jgi:hypothetical protein
MLGYLASASPCNDHLLDIRWGQGFPAVGPKLGRVDYKLINQTLLVLNLSVHKKYPLPPGFTAEAVYSGPLNPGPHAPVAATYLRGILQAPHILAGHVVEIVIRREAWALIVMVHCEDLHTTLRKVFDMESDDFIKSFPSQGPQGALLSLVDGIQRDVEMKDWDVVTDYPVQI